MVENQLYYGDNLDVLRKSVAAESVDLIYLDPPFNSKRDYNLLFKTPKGHQSEASITAFEDSWHWGQQAENEFHEVLHQPNTNLAEIMRAFRTFLGENDMMAYLTMMANRLLEMHRVLKPTGSIYLHCDPTASHYLKIVLDGVFGKENFRNEIIWKRTSGHSDARGYGSSHDSIFFYAKTDRFLWNEIYQPYDPAYVEQYYRYTDESGRRFMSGDLGAAGLTGGGYTYQWKGVTRLWRCPVETMERLDREGRVFYTRNGIPRQKRYLDEAKGMPTQDLWTDLESLRSWHEERLGYPTQKPLALLERMISASSNEGDVILDPFCGCGTAVHAAEKLKRKWIGIDITHLAISLIEKRLKDAFGVRCKFEVHGTPKDLDAATDLAARDKYQFQWWAVSLVDAQPFQGKKKGADGGVDGVKYFYDINSKEALKIVISVKGGSLKADDIRALNHVREREKAEIALFISLNEPSSGMRADAAAAGFYTSANGKKYPRIQPLSINGLLSRSQRAEHPDYAPSVNFKKTKPENPDRQGRLL